MAPGKNKQAKPEIAIGDHVLIGGTRASYPGDWFLGTVVWVGAADFVAERYTLNGKTWREVYSLSEIRAKGTIAELNRAQDAARKGVAEYQQRVRDAEQALGAARDALFARLDEIAATGVPIIPPDFEQIDADHQAIRDAVEANEQADAGVPQAFLEARAEVEANWGDRYV